MKPPVNTDEHKSVVVSQKSFTSRKAFFQGVFYGVRPASRGGFPAPEQLHANKPGKLPHSNTVDHTFG